MTPETPRYPEPPHGRDINGLALALVFAAGMLTAGAGGIGWVVLLRWKGWL